MNEDRQGVFECRETIKKSFFGITIELTYVPLPTVYPKDYEITADGKKNIYWKVHYSFGKIIKFNFIAGHLNSKNRNDYYENLSVDLRMVMDGKKLLFECYY